MVHSFSIYVVFLLEKTAGSTGNGTEDQSSKRTNPTFDDSSSESSSSHLLNQQKKTSRQISNKNGKSTHLFTNASDFAFPLQGNVSRVNEDLNDRQKAMTTDPASRRRDDVRSSRLIVDQASRTMRTGRSYSAIVRWQTLAVNGFSCCSSSDVTCFDHFQMRKPVCLVMMSMIRDQTLLQRPTFTRCNPSIRLLQVREHPNDL